MELQKNRSFIFGIKEQWFTSSSYSILLKRNMKFNRSQYISNNHDKNITRSSWVPSESKKKMHLYLIYLLSIILLDLFLLPMGTFPRSKTKSRKSRNREVRRVLMTYVSVFFRSDYSICSSGIVQWIFFLQAVTRPYLFF